MIHLREIDEDNFKTIVDMKRPEEERYVAPNVYSIAQAWLYRKNNDVFPYAIYDDETPVGFVLLDEDLEEKELMIWRIMFPEEHQFKGYGTKAIKKIIQDAKESQNFHKVIIDYVIGNEIAKHIYEKIGFQATGEISNGEVCMELDLKKYNA